VLRAWERRYGVVSPTRTPGGQRLYSDQDVARLLRLRRLTDRGHSIAHIAALSLPELIRLDEESAVQPAFRPPAGDGKDLEQEEEDREAVVAVIAALQATRRLDAVELQAVLERAAVTLGVPLFIDRVAAPALRSIGHGWSEGSVSVAQEHMATAVFRRVLGWLLRVYEARAEAPRLVVATPPGHAHELGALMAAATAAAEGWNVTYLGPDLPVADLIGAAAQSGAQAVALSAVHQIGGADLLGSLREIRAALPPATSLLVGGTEALRLRAEVLAAGARLVESLADFRDLLPRLAEEPAA
jgi:methanogenic corrinoid protein MtbC1